MVPIVQALDRGSKTMLRVYYGIFRIFWADPGT